jgi:hypothetical protein
MRRGARVVRREVRAPAVVYACQGATGTITQGHPHPYITHLLAVAAIVGGSGATEDEVVAALLHDAPRTAGEVRLGDIRLRFGDAVAEIAAGCTDTPRTPRPPWQRAQGTPLGPPGGRLGFSCARLRGRTSCTTPASVLSDYRPVGENLWSLFTGGREGTLWYYRAVVDALAAKHDEPLVEELDRVVRELELLTAETGVPAAPRSLRHHALDVLGERGVDVYGVSDHRVRRAGIHQGRRTRVPTRIPRRRGQQPPG